MCGSMVDIQSATAEIRRGKYQERKKKQDKNIMSASATHGGHNKHWGARRTHESILVIAIHTLTQHILRHFVKYSITHKFGS